MEKYQAFAYCGIHCGTCRNYRQNMNCQGCREERTLLADCPTRICAASRSVLHCGECCDFPCHELEAFYYDGKPSHLQAYKNVLEVVEKGLAQWLSEQSLGEIMAHAPEEGAPE